MGLFWGGFVQAGFDLPMALWANRILWAARAIERERERQGITKADCRESLAQAPKHHLLPLRPPLDPAGAEEAPAPRAAGDDRGAIRGRAAHTVRHVPAGARGADQGAL